MDRESIQAEVDRLRAMAGQPVRVEYAPDPIPPAGYRPAVMCDDRPATHLTLFAPLPGEIQRRLDIVVLPALSRGEDVTIEVKP